MLARSGIVLLLLLSVVIIAQSNPWQSCDNNGDCPSGKTCANEKCMPTPNDDDSDDIFEAYGGFTSD